MQQLDGVNLVTAEKLVEGARDTFGRATQALTIRIVAGPLKQGAHRRLRFLSGRTTAANDERGALPHSRLMATGSVMLTCRCGQIQPVHCVS